MEQGILLVIVSLIIIVIAAVILFIFSVSFITSIGAASFGGKCFFAFAEASATNYVYAILDFASPVLGQPLALGKSINYISASSVQASCEQASNINGQNTATLAQQIYSKASSCFSLFQGANANIGTQILDSNLNWVFECYSGVVYNSEAPGNVSDYGDIINYIDNNYPNSNGDPLQIVFMTNGSNNEAAYANANSKLFNGSRYMIEYFGYNGTFTQSKCQLNFAKQCNYVSRFDQPNISQSQCDSSTPYVPEVYYPVSSISSPGSPISNNPAYENLGACTGADYVIAFCGKLITPMMLSQSRVFVCIVNGSS
jgi:hypothetical protein